MRMKFQYIWTEHTLIRDEEWNKMRVEDWEIIESNIDLSKEARGFKKIIEKAQNYIPETRILKNYENKTIKARAGIEELREMYIEKYWKNVPINKKNDIQWILEKLWN